MTASVSGRIIALAGAARDISPLLSPLISARAHVLTCTPRGGLRVLRRRFPPSPFWMARDAARGELAASLRDTAIERFGRIDVALLFQARALGAKPLQEAMADQGYGLLIVVGAKNGMSHASPPVLLQVQPEEATVERLLTLLSLPVRGGTRNTESAWASLREEGER